VAVGNLSVFGYFIIIIITIITKLVWHTNSSKVEPHLIYCFQHYRCKMKARLLIRLDPKFKTRSSAIADKPPTSDWPDFATLTHSSPS